MKLEQKLEEIKLHNKSLTDEKFKITREYFELRLKQEHQLYKLAEIQKQQTNEYKAKLKITKNISAEKIHKYAVKYKKVATLDNIDKLVKTTFDDLISDFDYNCVIHYENNKEIITEYIKEVFKLYIYFVQVKNKLKIELKSFNMNISSALLIQLVSEYTVFKRNLEVIAKLDYNYENFQTLIKEQQTLEPIITEIFLTVVTKKDNYIKELEKQNKQIEDIKINDKIDKNINTIKEQNSTKESELENIVNTSFIELKDDEDVIKYKKRLKELEARAEERKLKKANMTKEEREKLKQKKKDNEILVAKMFKLE